MVDAVICGDDDHVVLVGEHGSVINRIEQCFPWRTLGGGTLADILFKSG